MDPQKAPERGLLGAILSVLGAVSLPYRGGSEKSVAGSGLYRMLKRKREGRNDASSSGVEQAAEIRRVAEIGEDGDRDGKREATEET
jgi:hypothetical protein